MRHSPTLYLLTLMALGALAGCQESGTEPTVVTAESPVTAQAPSTYPEEPTGIYTAAFREQAKDTDDDGIADHEDPNPNQAPQRPQAGGELSLNRVSAPRASRDLAGWVIPGEPVELETTGLHHYGNPWWVRWHHADGILAQQVTPDADGRVQMIAPEVMPHAVSIVAGHYVSDTLAVRSVMARAPLVYPVTKPFRAGEQIRLSGERLDQIEALWLGDARLTVQSATEQHLELDLPALPASQTFSWQDTQGRTHSMDLPVVRPVRFQADTRLTDPGGWRLLTDEAAFDLATPVTVWLPAGETQVLRWTRNDRTHSALSLVLPQTTRVSVGARNMASAWLWRYRTGLGGSREMDFDTLLPTLTDQLGSTESALVHALNGDTSSYAAARQTFNTSAPALAWREPDETSDVMARWGILNYVGDTLDAVFAGGPLYEPIVNVTNLRAKPGSANYANIGIGSSRDLITCGSVLGRPSGLWPSDLCLENDSAVFVSARVVDWRSGEVLADHIESPLDANIVGGTGMGILNLATVSFLSGNGGTLCKMRPCRIEVLTGGLGLWTSPNLTNREKQIANWLLARSLMDRVVLPIIEEVTGLSSGSSTLSCFAEQLLEPQGTESVGYLITINDFMQKVAQSTTASEVLNHTLETIVPAMLEKMQGMATDDDFIPCLTKMATDEKSEALGNVANRLSEVASSAAVPLRIAEVVSTAYDQWEVLTNPRKIVFEASPRASITELTTSGGTDRHLYSDRPSQYLRLKGTYLVDPLDDGYYPDLSIRDQSGVQLTMPVTESHVFDASDMSWVELRIPVSDLAPYFNQLGGDRFDLDLVLSHQTFDDFPNDLLRLPGTEVRWVGDARAIGLGSGLVRAGDTALLRGENLSRVNQPDLQVVLSNATHGDFTAESVRYRDATRISFRVPDYVPTGDYALLVLTANGPDMVAENNAEVISANSSWLQLTDNGDHQDDEMIMTLSNDQAGELIPANVNTAISLPTWNNDWSLWVGWEVTELTDSGGQPQTLDEVTVTCLDGQEDGVCTVRLTGMIDGAREVNEQATMGQNDTLTVNP